MVDRFNVYSTWSPNFLIGTIPNDKVTDEIISVNQLEDVNPNFNIKRHTKLKSTLIQFELHVMYVSYW